jgi:hypothetical protein
LATIAVAKAAFAGLGVLRRRPWAPLAWGTLYVGAGGAALGLLGAAFVMSLARLAALRIGTHPGQAPPATQTAQVNELLALFGAVAGGYVLLIVVFWVVGSVINVAVVRSILEPEKSAFAYLRLGAAELWLMLANLALFILNVIASTALTLPLALVMGLSALIWPRLTPFIALPAQVATWILYIWLWLRFCMVAPMIFTERRFRLFESWAFTRGHVWRLFLVALLMALATLVIYAVVAAVAVGLGLTFMQDALRDLRGLFAQSPAQAWRTLSPFLLAYLGLGWLASIVLLPLFFAPWPAAYSQLKGDELAATFG